MGNNSSQNLENQIFEMKFASKQLEKASKKCEKQEAAEKKKLVAAIKAGNHDIGRVYAENAIRHKNQGLSYLRLSARLDAVAGRIQTVQNVKQVSKQMARVTNIIGATFKSVDLEKTAMTMDVFEKQFEQLDLVLATMENSMNMATASVMPEDQVETLMRQVADENGLELAQDLDSIAVPQHIKEEKKVEQKDSDLSARIEALSRS